MAKQDINIGSGELTGDGESIRSALNKTNLNFTEVYNDISVLQSTSFSGDYNDLTNLPTIPSAVSELANDSGYLAAETDPIFIASPAAQIQQSNITNWNEAYGWGDHSQAGYLTTANTFSGSYNDLTDTPTIPTNTSELVNDSGYITTYTVTQADVTQYQQALSITESQISNLQSYLTSIVNENIEDLSNVDTTGLADGNTLIYNATSGNWEVSTTSGVSLTSFSVTAPNAAFGSGGLDYNNTTGAFTYTPPDLSSYLTAEVDTLDSVVARNAATATQVELNGGIITSGIESTNGVSSVSIAEGSALTIGSTAGVKIVGAATATVDLGTETSGTVTIGSGSNTVVLTNGAEIGSAGSIVFETENDPVAWSNGSINTQDYSYLFNFPTNQSDATAPLLIGWNDRPYLKPFLETSIGASEATQGVFKRSISIEGGNATETRVPGNVYLTFGRNISAATFGDIIIGNAGAGDIYIGKDPANNTSHTGTINIGGNNSSSTLRGTVDFTNATVTGLPSSSYSDTDVATYLNGNLNTSIIPDTNSTYDIGSAEFKIRHFYLSNNSMKFVDDSDPQNPVEYPLGVSNDYRLQFNGQPIKNSSSSDAPIGGAIDITVTNHFIVPGQNYTLADGTYIGQELKFWRNPGSGFNDITVANAIWTNGSLVTAAATNFTWRLEELSTGMYSCIWNGTGWILANGSIGA